MNFFSEIILIQTVDLNWHRWHLTLGIEWHRWQCIFGMAVLVPLHGTVYMALLTWNGTIGKVVISITLQVKSYILERLKLCIEKVIK